jgi:hypothetical protein
MLAKTGRGSEKTPAGGGPVLEKAAGGQGAESFPVQASLRLVLRSAAKIPVSCSKKEASASKAGASF